MKKSIIMVVSLFIVLLLLISVALFWRGPATTKVELAGVAGSAFTGYYIQDGQRTAVSGALPWSVQGLGISEFEFHKVHPEDAFTLTAHYDEPRGIHGVHVIEVPSGVVGLRDKFHHHGMYTEKL